MKLKRRLVTSLGTLLVVLLLLCQTALAADFSKLVILHTNDTHGFDMHGDGHNGMSVIAAVKKDYEAKGYNVLLLDAGDAIQDNNLVNFSKGRTAIAFFNQVGYDAGTLGNHEFDYGQDVLAQRLREARYAIVSSNVIVEATGKTLVPERITFQKGDVKVGIVGLTTPETMVSTSPKNIVGLKFLAGEELYKNTQRIVDELKADGCDLIIGLGHLGSEDGCMGNRSDDILMNVKGIDIFIDGHDHQVKNKYINGALQTETGNYTNNIGRVVYEDGKWVEKLVGFGEYTEEDPQVKALVDEAAAEVEEHLGKVLGESKVELEGKRDPGCRTMETNSGDFLADAYLWQARQANVLDGTAVDAAIVNGGSIRKALKAGRIIRADITSVQPYNNQIFVATITGEKLLEIFEAATCTIPDAMGAFPQVAGITYTLDTTVPYAQGPQYPDSLFFAPAKPGSRVTIETVAGKPFDVNAVYNIAMAEFLTIGGDAYGGLAAQDSKLGCQGIGYVDAEAVENYLVSELGGVIGEEYAEPQGRITIK